MLSIVAVAAEKAVEVPFQVLQVPLSRVTVGAEKIVEVPIPKKVDSEGFPPNLLVMDAPWAFHIPKLVIWYVPSRLC